MLYNFDNDTIQKKKIAISHYILSVSLTGDWTFQIILSTDKEGCFEMT